MRVYLREHIEYDLLAINSNIFKMTVGNFTDI